MWEGFLKSFIPLFVALDVLGVLPLYARFSLDLDKQKRGKVLRDSIITAFLVTLVFIAIGNKVLLYLNISIDDFLIAGGVILFIISTRDLLGGGRNDLAGQEDLFAVVPSGCRFSRAPPCSRHPSSSSILSASSISSSPSCSTCSSRERFLSTHSPFSDSSAADGWRRYRRCSCCSSPALPSCSSGRAFRACGCCNRGPGNSLEKRDALYGRAETSEDREVGQWQRRVSEDRR